MRELKYRQRVDNRWHYWGYIDGCFIGPVTNQQPNPINCEYTGLKDVNGVEIYEGDIIKSRFSNKYGGKVIFKDGCFEMETAEGHTHCLADNNVSEDSVIGNIHENPELLE